MIDGYDELYFWLDGQYSIRLAHADEWVLDECPYCGGKQKAFINPAKGVVNCFKCTMGWRLLDWLEEQTGWPRNQCRDLIAGRPNVGDFDNIADKLQHESAAAPAVMRTPWSPDFHLIGAGVCKADEYAQQYLLNRGFVREHWEAYQLAYATVGRYTNRIIIPVFELGTVVYLQARTWGYGVTPKYLNPKASEGFLGKSDVVFNLDIACLFDRLVICEGAFSAMSVGINAVATFGKTLSERQRSLIMKRSAAKEIIVAYDYGTEREARDTIDKLQGFGRRVGYLPLPDDRDHNDHRMQGGAAQVDGLFAGVRWSDGWSTLVV